MSASLPLHPTSVPLTLTCVVGLACAGCIDRGPGPTFRMTLRTQLGDAIQAEDAQLGLRAVRLAPCDEGPAEPAFPQTYGITPPHNLRGLSIRPPIGPWCHLDLVNTGPLEAVLQTNLAEITLDLRVPHLALSEAEGPFAEPERVRRDDGNIRTAGVGVFVELGAVGWLDPILDLDVDTQIGPDHDLHDTLVDALISTSSAYADLDRDGRLSRTERENHRIGALAAITTTQD